MLFCVARAFKNEPGKELKLTPLGDINFNTYIVNNKILNIRNAVLCYLKQTLHY